MRRSMLLLVVTALLGSCTVSTWQEHTTALQEARASHNLEAAMREQRWLIDHAFEAAPAEQRTRQAEGKRYLALAELTAQAGQTGETIEMLRVALRTDPHQHKAIMKLLNALPLAPKDRRRVDAEFRWNLMVLLPGLPPPPDDELPCWAYRVRQIRVSRIEVRQGMEGARRVLSYDARSWVYDPDDDSWYPDGDWFDDIGAETEPVNGPPQPRYDAIKAADGGFFTQGPIPPCHRRRWSGPYDEARNRLFVARDLPGKVR